MQSSALAGGKPWVIPPAQDATVRRPHPARTARAKAAREQAALDAVRAGGVTYSYTCDRRPRLRPEPVTAATLAVRVTGADGRTVRALERRGLVRMVALTPQGGRYALVPQETEEGTS